MQAFEIDHVPVAPKPVISNNSTRFPVNFPVNTDQTRGLWRNETQVLLMILAGTEFIDENGGGPGVRLRKAAPEEGLGCQGDLAGAPIGPITMRTS